MNLKVGDNIGVDGREATIISKFSAGKYTRYVLSDGRELLDLHKREDVKVIVPTYEDKQFSYTKDPVNKRNQD
jgi:hypothetical protein